MVKMTSTGITIEVPENEVYLYQRAGYSVVIDTPAPVETELQKEPEESPAPVEKKSTKK